MELFLLGKAEEREERGKGDVEKTLRLPSEVPPPQPLGSGRRHSAPSRRFSGRRHSAPSRRFSILGAVASETAPPQGLLGTTEGSVTWKVEKQGRQTGRGGAVVEGRGRKKGQRAGGPGTQTEVCGGRRRWWGGCPCPCP